MENSKYTQHNNQPNSNNKRKNVTTDQLEQWILKENSIN
jgi:hypothetical protein